MICKKCGYDYPAKELKCPYCGEPNPLGEKWRNEENLARKEALLAKAKIIHSMPLYVADKVMNVILLVVVAVTAITILVLAIGVGLEDIHITCQRNRASVQEAEELLAAEDYTGLYDYLHSYEVYGQEEFEKYTERVRLYDDDQAFMRDLFRIQEVLDWPAGQQMHPNWVKYVLLDGKDILEMETDFSYRGLEYEENKEYYDDMKQDVAAALLGTLEMTEEELLELIDFREKRDYSLAKITEEIEAGDYEYVKTEDSALPGDMSQESGSQQTQGAGEASVVPGADTAAQEWQIAYAGELSIRCAVAAEQGLYVGGFTMEGKARVEYLTYGSGTPEKFYDDFDEDGEVYSLCIAPDGSVYAALRGLASPGAEHGRLPVIYHISPEGKLLNSFTVGEREWNIVDSMATDAQGRLYMRMRMQEDGSYVRIYSAEGELIGTVADDNNYAVQGAGALGQGKDGKVYAAAQAVGNTTAGDMAMTLVSVDPESLRFVPVAGGENVICSADTIYPWKMVAAGVSETADFILWGYNGVDTYRLGETEFTRVQENWEMPCGTEGTCAVLVPDGRILYIGASGGFQGTTADGVEISGKDPAQTVLYYEPLVK